MSATSPLPQSLPRILVVDTPDAASADLCTYLCGYRLAAAAEVAIEAIHARLEAGTVDLVVLDLHAPGSEHGIALAHHLRRAAIPFILLSTYAEPVERVIGLELGADDFLAKPYHRRELVARIQVVLRRLVRAAVADLEPLARDVIQFDGWKLQRSARRLTSPDGLAVALSGSEYQLLSTMLKTPRRVFSRAELLAEARGAEPDELERSVDQLVSRLRQKLRANAAQAPIIKTVRGAGYLLDAQAVH